MVCFFFSIKNLIPDPYFFLILIFDLQTFRAAVIPIPNLKINSDFLTPKICWSVIPDSSCQILTPVPKNMLIPYIVYTKSKRPTQAKQHSDLPWQHCFYNITTKMFQPFDVLNSTEKRSSCLRLLFSFSATWVQLVNWCSVFLWRTTWVLMSRAAIANSTKTFVFSKIRKGCVLPLRAFAANGHVV